MRMTTCVEFTFREVFSMHLPITVSFEKCDSFVWYLRAKTLCTLVKISTSCAVFHMCVFGEFKLGLKLLFTNRALEFFPIEEVEFHTTIN